MNKKISATDYGLKSTVVLERTSGGTIAIILNRKSRVVMKDGLKILEQARKIRKKEAGVTIMVRTQAPLCSKTRAFLEKKGISFENI